LIFDYWLFLAIISHADDIFDYVTIDAIIHYY
jgi:hypothetical protein